jgi:hypothetical protein
MQIVQDFDPAWPGVETWLERTRPALTAILSAAAAVVDPDAIVSTPRSRSATPFSPVA